jgi:hypothetical protein
MTASDVEDAIALLDAEPIHDAQILAPGFASHDEGNHSTQESPSVPGLLSDKMWAAHAELWLMPEPLACQK